ncbi:MAG: hypothetical protein IPG86_03845 [Chitinophagaceae bacterium]|nr:hypothetical protein [Chitinophagaceae bacterium]
MEQGVSIQVSGSADHQFYRRRHNSTIAFAIGILLFLLPFVEFKCGNMALIGNSGIGLVIGSHWKVSSSWAKNELRERMGKGKTEAESLLKDGPNIFAIAALAAGLFGLGIAFSSFNWRSMAGMCAGILAALMLIAVMVKFKIEMRGLTSGKKLGDDQLGLDVGGLLKIQFTIWYYFSLLAFIAAAFFNYMRDKLALRDAMAAAVDFDFQRQEQAPGN